MTETPAGAEPSESGRRLRRWGRVAAGPLIIVAAVLVVLNGFAFRGLGTNQHPDILAMWLPTHCFLGRSLLAGHIPAWNPYILSGTPFASDPQSGWLYLPAMLLYTALPCASALGWFIALQPVLAGLGIFGFLRSEGLSRMAATCGGLVMALLIADSYLSIQLPFSGAIAWGAVVLAAASRFVRTRRGWPARLGWLAAAAVAWGQVASAHLSDGLVIVTFALAVYVAVALGSQVRSRAVTGREALVMAGVLALALPLVNLAVLLPRLVYLPRTTLGTSYGELARRTAEFAGRHALREAPIGDVARPAWPLALAGPVGAYAGAVPLAMALGGWRRSKALFFGFAGVAATCYVLSLGEVARALRGVLSGSRLGNFYLHVPERFRLGVVLVLPVLVALGIEAWRAETRWERRLWLAAPGVLLWWVIAPAVGDVPHEGWLLAAGAAVGGAIAVAGVRRPAVLMALPAVLAVELVVNGLLAQTPQYSPGGHIEIPASTLGFPPMRGPEIRMADYFREGPIARSLRGPPPGRYASVPPVGGRRALIPYQEPRYWPLLGNQRSMLFGLQSVDGVNPVQSMRYWSFVRATQREGIYYNASFYRRVPALAEDLLQMKAVVLSRGSACRHAIVGAPATAASTEGGAALCRLDTVVTRASVVLRWRVVGSAEEALRAVTAPGFDPSREVILERDPGLAGASGAGAGGDATYRDSGDQSALVTVEAPGPAIVLIRTSYDPNWHATVDGRDAQVLAADSVAQGVAVPAGHHVIRLSYDDPWVGRGLAGSVVVLLSIGGGALAGPWMGRVRRRRGKGAHDD